MVHPAADLVQHVQRRELSAYEHRLARQAYAYGVDLRRSRWLDASSLGQPLMRIVDRRWAELTEGLSGDMLAPLASAPPMVVLEQIARLARLLRAPSPTVRCLRREVAERDAWPHATPLGTTKGGMHWLILDIDGLLALDEKPRAFLLGAALAHLQCDHGPMFSAHLAAHRAGRGLGFVRRLLAPWTRVATFSADRGGLLAAGELESAVDGLRMSASRTPDWAPRTPTLEVRESGLREFDRAAVVARLRLLEARKSDGAAGPTLAPKLPKAAGPLPDTPQQPAAPDPDLEVALKKAWSLARCDERLTRRLGLL